MAVTLPDFTSLGRSPVPMGNRGFARQDTTAPGQAVEGLGQVVGKIGEEFAQRDDEQKVLEYRRKLIEWDKANVHDPETGAAGKKGPAAFDLPKTLPQEFDKFAAEAASGLSSNRQRRLAQEMALGRREQIINWASGHAAKQRSVFDQGEALANNNESKDNAAMWGGQNPDMLANELRTMEGATRAYLSKLGAGPEAINDAVKKDASEVYRRIIHKMVSDGDVDKANAMFADVASKKGFVAQDYQALSDQLKVSGDRVAVQRFEDRVLADPNMTEQDATALARKEFTGERRDAAVARVEHLFTQKKKKIEEDTRLVVKDAWATVIETRNLGQLQPVHHGLLRSMAPEAEREMTNWIDAMDRRDKMNAKEKNEGDWGTYMMLVDMASKDPATFSDPQTFLRYEGFLSDQQKNQIQSLRTGVDKKDVLAQNLLTIGKHVETTLYRDIQQAGIDLTPKENEKDKIATLAQFRGELRMALDEAQRRKGRALDPDEALVEGRRMIATGIEQGSGWFGTTVMQTKKRGFELAAEKRSSIGTGAVVPTYVAKNFGDIPAKIRADLVETHASRMERAKTPLARSIYGARPYMLESSDKAAIELAYQRGVEAGIFPR